VERLFIFRRDRNQIQGNPDPCYVLKGAATAPYEMSFQQVLQVEAPPSDRSQPTPPVPPGAVGVEKYEVRPTETIEEWNSTELGDRSDSKNKVCCERFLSFQERFDQFGEPVYAVSGSPIIVPQPRQGS